MKSWANNRLAWKLVQLVLRSNNLKRWWCTEKKIATTIDGDEGPIVIDLTPVMRYDGPLPPMVSVRYNGFIVFKASVDELSIFPPIGDFIYVPEVYYPGNWEIALRDALNSIF